MTKSYKDQSGTKQITEAPLFLPADNKFAQRFTTNSVINCEINPQETTEGKLIYFSKNATIFNTESLDTSE